MRARIEPPVDRLVMTCAADAAGNFDRFDEAWLTFGGSTLADEAGLGWTRRIHPEDREGFVHAYRAAFDRGLPFGTVFRLKRADGEYRWIAWTGAPVPGERRRYMATGVDVTSERTELDELRVLKSRLELWAQLSPGGVFSAVQKPDAKIELAFLSEAGGRLLSVDVAELARDPMGAAIASIAPEDRETMLEQIRRSARNLEPIAVDFRALAEGGASRWLRAEAAPRKLPDGDVLWSGILLDIGARKEFEDMIVERQRHYETVLQTSIDGYWTTDMQGRFVEVNDAYCKLIGYGRDELLKMSIRDVEARESAEDTARHIEIVMRQGSDRFETRHRRKDGRVVDVEVSTVYVPDRGGGLVVFLRDITDRNRGEAERAELLRREQQARQAAEQANQTKDTFLATLSHELRTPMTTIFSWAQLIQRGRLTPEKTIAAAEAIERSARTQTKLIDDMLDVSRIMKGKLSVEKVNIDPRSPLLAAVESIRPQADGKRIAIDLDLDGVGRGMLVHGDPTRLEQVFWNLLSNAVKFTAPGGTVKVSLEGADHDGRGRSGEFACVRVKDTGPGVPKELQDRIFDPFVQKDSSTTRAHGGLGLGLAIVKSLLEMHDGSVNVESEGVGNGATFAVCLPLVGTSEEEAIDRPKAKAETAGKQLDGVAVLVVDDEPPVCEVIKTLLGSEGANVQVAASAQEALTLIRKSRPQVLISDIRMPFQDGYSLLKEVRAADQAEGRGLLPVIALTAQTGPAEAARAREAGFQLHLAKPIDAGVLVASVRQTLGLPPR